MRPMSSATAALADAGIDTSITAVAWVRISLLMPCSSLVQEVFMKREVIRVEPLSSYLAKWNAPLSPVTRGNGMVFVSGFPPFDPATGEIIIGASIERQTEIVLEQMKLCLETSGTSLQNVMKCNIYCTSAKHFAAVNAIYARYFPVDPPARIFVCVPEWMGPFDIEIDCVAMA